MKRILLIIIFVLSAAALVFGICCFTGAIDLKPNEQTPPATDDTNNPVVEESGRVDIYVNETIKTTYYVNEEIEDLKKYFNVYESLKTIETLDDFITGTVDNTVAGQYEITCSYKETSEKVVINVIDKVEMFVTEDRLIFEKDSEIIPFNTYFKIKVNGLYIDINDEYITSSVDFSTLGEYVVSCKYNDKKVELVVVIIEKENGEENNPDETPEPNPTPLPDEDVYEMKYIGEENYSINSTIDITTILEFYLNNELIDAPYFTYETDLNVHMAGTYAVKVKLQHNHKEYEFETTITIKELEENIITDYEVNSYKETLIPTYSGYMENAIYRVKTDEDTNTTTFKPFQSKGIFFFYDSSIEEDVITLAHLLKYYSEYSNNEKYNLYKLYVYDINQKTKESEENPDDFTSTKFVIDAYNSNEFNYFLTDDEIQSGKINIQGKLFVYDRNNGNPIMYNLEFANRHYSYKMYTNYLNQYFKTN